MDYIQVAAQQDRARQQEFMALLISKMDGLADKIAAVEAKLDALQPKKPTKE